jgi:hypothetical protein
MSGRLRHLWNRHRILVSMFAAAAALTLFFLVRMIVVTIHWSDPGNHDLAIEAWMPVRYVAYSWDVPPEVIGEALGIATRANMTIADIAKSRNSDVATISDEVMAAIAVWRAEHGSD